MDIKKNLRSPRLQPTPLGRFRGSGAVLVRFNCGTIKRNVKPNSNHSGRVEIKKEPAAPSCNGFKISFRLKNRHLLGAVNFFQVFQQLIGCKVSPEDLSFGIYQYVRRQGSEEEIFHVGRFALRFVLIDVGPRGGAAVERGFPGLEIVDRYADDIEALAAVSLMKIAVLHAKFSALVAIRLPEIDQRQLVFGIIIFEFLIIERAARQFRNLCASSEGFVLSNLLSNLLSKGAFLYFRIQSVHQLLVAVDGIGQVGRIGYNRRGYQLVGVFGYKTFVVSCDTGFG